MKRIFNYINDIGYHKQLVVEDIPENDELHVELFAYGELCGVGDMTREKINQYLEHYGVKERI